MLVLRADQPEVDQLNYGESLREPPRRREWIELAVMKAYLNPSPRQLLLGPPTDKARPFGRALWPFKLQHDIFLVV